MKKILQGAQRRGKGDGTGERVRVDPRSPDLKEVAGDNGLWRWGNVDGLVAEEVWKSGQKRGGEVRVYIGQKSRRLRDQIAAI